MLSEPFPAHLIGLYLSSCLSRVVSFSTPGLPVSLCLSSLCCHVSAVLPLSVCLFLSRSLFHTLAPGPLHWLSPLPAALSLQIPMACSLIFFKDLLKCHLRVAFPEYLSSNCPAPPTLHIPFLALIFPSHLSSPAIPFCLFRGM